ncbi:hypothetical protein I5L03_01880 [Erythrobacter sp. JGD-13]|uniref:Uncharacterized protein n=2 Tax=Aurantiacibacter sediminis TaxID=2793064 RepID=A0ABS0N037_9SPHN|nr:hypothetical protein [Aurantiacibacter sediminis]
MSASETMANASALSMRWAALSEAGKVVCMLAGQDAEPDDKRARNFPALIRDAEPWRRDLAKDGCADLAAIMEPGISALLAINARGADCTDAASALWSEYTAARASILDLLPPSGEMGPRRSA